MVKPGRTASAGPRRARPGLPGEEREQLVGLRPVARAGLLRRGASLRAGSGVAAANGQGYVTSVCWSPALGHDSRSGSCGTGGRGTASGCGRSARCGGSTRCRGVRRRSSTPREGGCVAGLAAATPCEGLGLPVRRAAGRADGAAARPLAVVTRPAGGVRLGIGQWLVGGAGEVDLSDAFAGLADRGGGRGRCAVAAGSSRLVGRAAGANTAAAHARRRDGAGGGVRPPGAAVLRGERGGGGRGGDAGRGGAAGRGREMTRFPSRGRPVPAAAMAMRGRGVAGPCAQSGEGRMVRRARPVRRVRVTADEAAGLVRSGMWLDYGASSASRTSSTRRWPRARTNSATSRSAPACRSGRAPCWRPTRTASTSAGSTCISPATTGSSTTPAARHYMPMNFGEIPDYYRRFIDPVDIVDPEDLPDGRGRLLQLRRLPTSGTAR